MSMIITEDCINCDACAIECLEQAIYFTGKPAAIKDLKFYPLSSDHYYIIPNLCNECSEIEEARCVSVCPMNSIQKIDNYKFEMQLE